MECDVNEILDLGVVLGQNQAFGFLAGRCSAVQAENLLRLRSEKLYKRVAEHWRDFCPQYLKMSASQVDHIIRLWEEFGAGYFEIAQFTRVSPETYRALEPAVENGVLHLNGEKIELILENSRKVAAAVAEVRRKLPPKSAAELPIGERVDRLAKLCDTLTEQVTALPDISGEDFQRCRVSLLNLYTFLNELRSQFRY